MWIVDAVTTGTTVTHSWLIQPTQETMVAVASHLIVQWPDVFDVLEPSNDGALSPEAQFSDAPRRPGFRAVRTR